MQDLFFAFRGKFVNCQGIENGSGESSLTHWPVKIKLIPASAWFLKGAELLVLADCTAVAYPYLHSDLMKGRVVMTGCPKFDDVKEYEQKFADIFHTADINVTVVIKEVPCCAGMSVIVKRIGSGTKKIHMQEIVVNSRGGNVKVLS